MSVGQVPTLLFVDGAPAPRALIAHRHPPATAPAEHQALQERGALTGTTGHPRQIRAIAGQLLGISHVLLPTDRGRMGIGDDDRPLVLWLLESPHPCDLPRFHHRLAPSTSIDIGPGVVFQKWRWPCLYRPFKGIAVDEQANDDIVHLCRFRKA